MSLDGKTAPANRKGRLFTQLMDKTLLGRLHKLRAEVDAVLVGSGTVIEDNPRLTVRAVAGKNPLRVVLDSMASSPLQSEIFKVEDAPTIIAVSAAAPAERIARMAERGVEVIRFDCEGTIPLEELLESDRSEVKKKLPPGKEVQVEIISIDGENKIRLSQKSIQDKEDRGDYEKFVQRKKRGSLGTLGDLFEKLKR